MHSRLRPLSAAAAAFYASSAHLFFVCPFSTPSADVTYLKNVNGTVLLPDIGCEKTK
jgi:hypothetical protein